MSRARAADSGVSYLEVLAALALLGVILTTSFAVVDQARVQRRVATERLHVLQAIDNEIETLAALPLRLLGTRLDAPFVSAAPALASLPSVDATTTIATSTHPGLLRFVVRVRWGPTGRRHTEVAELLFDAASVDGGWR